MTNKTDLRIVKTQRALVETFFDMLCEKKFEEITVQAICEKAMVRRATFYNHFIDKYDLFTFTLRYVYNSFPSSSKHVSSISTKSFYIEFLTDIISFLSVNQKLVQSILKSNLLPFMINIIYEEISKELTSRFEEEFRINNNEDISVEITVNFYISAILGVILWWLKKKPSLNEQEIIAQITSILNI